MWRDTKAMGSLGWQELLLILFIVLVVFGAGRVPEIFRAMGSGIGEFKKGLKDSSPSDSTSASKPGPDGSSKEN